MGHNRSRYLVAGIAVALLLMVAGLPAANSSAEQPASLAPQPARRDVTYCAPDGVPLKMDIYAPSPSGYTSAPANGYPVVMFVHGGGWTGGDKASEEGVLETAELIARGYLVVSINYRLAPKHVFPAPIHDVKCAVRYLRANASSLNIDPNRIGAWGASAGGHLVSFLGTADAGAEMEGNGGYADQSSRVQAVADMYGRADLSEVPHTRPDLLPIFGGEENLSRHSPITYVSKDDPPFLILHGDQDSVVPAHLSQRFYDRLKEVGVPATLVMVKNGGHGFTPTGGPISPSRPEITRMVGDFFDQHLKPVRSQAQAGPPRQSFQAPPLPPGGKSMDCPQTGKAVRSLFLDYWNSNGGVAQQGYPISDEMLEVSAADDKIYTVQYFERAVFEYHPENKPPYQVLSSLLGVQLYKARYPKGAPGQQPNNSADSVLFKQTNHRVGGAFLQYWRANGGVMQQGYPISDEFQEKSALDGKTYTVQYFERAVFELHPENNEANRVLLSQLGTFAYKQKHIPHERGR